MSTQAETLRDIYLEVTEQKTITEQQQESPSHDPIEQNIADLERSVQDSAQQDGLDEAVGPVTGTG